MPTFQGLQSPETQALVPYPLCIELRAQVPTTSKYVSSTTGTLTISDSSLNCTLSILPLLNSHFKTITEPANSLQTSLIYLLTRSYFGSSMNPPLQTPFNSPMDTSSNYKSGSESKLHSAQFTVNTVNNLPFLCDLLSSK
jgi:hypothetical protein